MVGAAAHRQTIWFAGKTFKDHRRDVTATIGTVVDDQTFFIQLRIEITGELIQTIHAHIRDIDISNTPVSRLIHFLDVILHPVVVIQRIFLGKRADHNLTCTSQLGFTVQ